MNTFECNAEESTEEVDNEKRDVMVSSDIIIPANSETIIDIETVQRLDFENLENLFDPNRDPELKIEGLFWSNCLNIVSGGYKTYLSVFNRNLNQGETIASFCTVIQEYLDDELAKFDEYARDQLLISRLISNVPENVKNFLELMSNK